MGELFVETMDSKSWVKASMPQAAVISGGAVQGQLRINNGNIRNKLVMAKGFFKSIRP